MRKRPQPVTPPAHPDLSTVRLKAKSRMAFTDALMNMSYRQLNRTPELATAMMTPEGDINPEYVFSFSSTFRDSEDKGLRLTFNVRIQTEALNDR